ncbi:FAD-dependent oxidoreductase [Leptolyngbya sp. AN02str]|uniref:FAD-dependent oxidoreductase n=1 Tax=Leptolyngbya sp. AN02str TaxID=3423363 RepID=UPI003D30F403
MSTVESILSGLAGNPLAGLRATDARLAAVRQQSLSISNAIAEHPEPLSDLEWDVVVCGGTLGILLGCALVQHGWKVALVEQGILRGRDQEWNISRHELQTLVQLGLLTADELEQAIATEYNPARIAFHGGEEFWVRDVLNIGVDPVYLLETLKTKFLQAGGRLFEQAPFQTATLHPNGVAVSTTATHAQRLTARLLIDVMGHFSPMAQQSRQGEVPDAICMVVGTCATGFPANETGDLFVTNTPTEHDRQYFWEAFPARDGRTTYLFTYVDADPQRPSLEQLFADYFALLPSYQQVELAQLHWKRSLFGFFPCYRNSPLKTRWHRVLHVGDSSGSQSPLSFGGFGALIRHLERLTIGIDEALQADLLDRQALGLLQPYQPSLSVTWLFQKSMSVGVGQPIAPEQINQLLGAVFREMANLGDPVLKPFLQDVVQFSALFQTLMMTTLHHPSMVFKIVPQVGVGALVDWMRHYLGLGVYTGLAQVGTALQPSLQALAPRQRYYVQRSLDAWIYGAGKDYRTKS